jgi:hypothetical protein
MGDFVHCREKIQIHRPAMADLQRQPRATRQIKLRYEILLTHPVKQAAHSVRNGFPIGRGQYGHT